MRAKHRVSDLLLVTEPCGMANFEQAGSKFCRQLQMSLAVKAVASTSRFNKSCIKHTDRRDGRDVAA